MKPFRWNIKKKEQLGNLLDGTRSFVHPSYIDEIRECAANVLSRSDKKRMIFVGRSPENIFDYLSGALQHTKMEQSLDILNISNRFYEIKELAKELPASYEALKRHFELLRISPDQIISSKQGICFVDLVSEGSTFDRLFEFIHKWCADEKVDINAVWRKIKFLGITIRTKNSPNTFRWYQHAKWLDYGIKIEAQSISIAWHMWNYLGNNQPKSSNTNRPQTWNDRQILLPPREKERLQALRMAYDVYHRGLQEKVIFAKELAKLPEYKEKWLRDVSLNIKSSKS